MMELEILRELIEIFGELVERVCDLDMEDVP
eukprot:CAMPEP_0172927080 /NCGR_PEP_ID=MMETSP1075-20121228/216846_1 /TAXON_ID=2916 /ORGANISM="Ceratium fusus, Strain PA161109" /LENGTH=30 /DNA_ID= /DNA_START= /DNA_END= /DNA_ORIENTATION=